MNKLSSTKVAEVLNQVGPALRALSGENQVLKEKIAQYEKRDRVEKIASTMEEKHLDPETSFDQKVESLMNADDLGVVEKAVELSAPQIKLAALSDHPGNPSDAASAFESGIVGD
jgi:hypothetical protein